MPKYYRKTDKPMNDLWKRAGFPSRRDFDNYRKYPDRRPEHRKRK